MKVAFIHNDKKIGTGAHYINDLMSEKLREQGIETKNFYPKVSLVDTPIHLGGIKSILFFYSLLERRREVLKYNIIQGTTYTPLPFLSYPVPVISHFGSTTRGFLECTPLAKDMEVETRKVWYKMRTEGAIGELNIKTRRPLRDIADVEEYVASHATAVIATSEKVKNELLAAGIDREKIHIIHNAIEDYWFENRSDNFFEPSIIFLGRLGNDAFTLKLKGLDRLVHIYQKFSGVRKVTFCMTKNKSLLSWLRTKIANHSLYVNVKKDKLPALLQSYKGGVLFLSSRYEGFSLSLIEGMSQGLIPVAYGVGVAPEIIKNGENGFIVSNQAEAIERMQEIFSNNELRKKMSDSAIATSLQFSSGEITKKLIGLYQTILDKTASCNLQKSSGSY